jgi:inward rectifier potassium channel
MAFNSKSKIKAKSKNDTGFGSNANSYGGRFVTKSGNANVRKTGIGFLDSISWYHTMLTIPRWKFMFIVVLFYFVVNSFFASLYYIIGVEHLNGITATNKMEQFGQAFFFSVQTFTTVGYGHISPSGFMASFVSSVEALFGLLSFAIATGLFYGRFSKPKAHLLFSDNAIIAPYQEGKALMIRLCPFKNTTLTDAEARMTLGLHIEDDGKMVNKFYSLDLELEKINALTLSWTLVHPINEKSPLYQFTKDDFNTIDGEIIVFIKAFDDLYSSNVVKRSSYTFKEVVYGVKYIPMFSRNDNDTKTILHVDKLNAFEKITLD